MLTFPIGLMKQNEQVDPYLANVVLHLKGDGANNSTNIIDSSPTLKTITRFGDAKLSTAQSKYGGSSILFDGTGNYLSIASSPDFSLTGDFTIEFWFYSNVMSTSSFISSNHTNFNSGDPFVIILHHATNPNVISVWNRLINANARILVTPTISLNTWNHFALCRQGTSIVAYLNGVGGTPITSSQTFNLSGNGAIKIGNYWNGSYNGYIDSLRITQGVPRYTANFNPDTDTYLAY